MAVAENSFETSVMSWTNEEAAIEARLQLRNTSDRALHYIASIRGLHYDPLTRELTVRLHDEGRLLIPGVANLHPSFQFVDPGGTSELVLKLPKEITRLVPSPDGDPGKVAFEVQPIAEAIVVSFEIVWSDVPFYPDQRSEKNDVMPSILWQQRKSIASLQIGDEPSLPPPPPASRQRRTKKAD